MANQTIFVTGATGYIAKHILVKLLNAGFNVVGSVRNLDRGDEVRAAVSPHLTNSDDLDARLRFVALDLGSDEGWDTALTGADALLHTASPFPLTMPKDPEKIIRPAVDGALRALKAAKAAGINRVVLTSSVVAVTSKETANDAQELTEEDWSDLDHPTMTPYTTSKTLAERAAWDFVKTEAPEIALTVINPAFVQGAPLDQNYGTSLKVVERLLVGKDPMLPKFGFTVVDVKDVAEMHLRALTHAGTAGKRFLAADRFLWFSEMAEILKAAHPNRKIVTREAPSFLVRFLAWFDPAIRSIVPSLGKKHVVSNARAREVMEMQFTDAADAVRSSGAFLIDNDLV